MEGFRVISVYVVREGEEKTPARDPAKTPVNQRDRKVYVACPNGHTLFDKGIKVGTMKKSAGSC